MRATRGEGRVPCCRPRNQRATGCRKPLDKPTQWRWHTLASNVRCRRLWGRAVAQPVSMAATGRAGARRVTGRTGRSLDQTGVIPGEFGQLPQRGPEQCHRMRVESAVVHLSLGRVPSNCAQRCSTSPRSRSSEEAPPSPAPLRPGTLARPSCLAAASAPAAPAARVRMPTLQLRRIRRMCSSEPRADARNEASLSDPMIRRTSPRSSGVAWQCLPAPLHGAAGADGPRPCLGLGDAGQSVATRSIAAPSLAQQQHELHPTLSARPSAQNTYTQRRRGTATR